VNVDLLSFLIQNELHIENMAKKASLKGEISVGIAKRILDNNGSLEGLSTKQMHHYQNVLLPLMENVTCEGPVGLLDGGASSCVNGEVIDDSSLLQSYTEDRFMCQICRFDSERMDNS
jgi:hypothetical protein